jgi:hypothetical protein
MSDIIYTPPASGGGGQNPTANYIPLNNGTSSFVDSNIINNKNNYIQTNFMGLNIDYNNRNFSLGDYDGNYNGTNIFIDDNNKYINFYADPITFLIDGLNNRTQFSYNGNEIGLKLDFANDLYSFADFNSVSSGTSFYIDVASSLMYTKHSGQQEGLFFDFVNDFFQIGDFAGTNNGTHITIHDDNRQIYTAFDGTDLGYKLDFATNVYSFGDFNFYNNNTSIIIDDNSSKITFTTNALNFVGASLTDGATVIPVNKNLLVTINGTQYHIPLYN